MPKCWSLSFNISPSNEYSGLISFRMDWLNLLSVQGTLKSLLQHHSSKASILWCSTFFIVQLSSPYITTSLVGTVNFSQLHVSSGCCVACCFLFVSPESENIPFPCLMYRSLVIQKLWGSLYRSQSYHCLCQSLFSMPVHILASLSFPNSNLPSQFLLPLSGLQTENAPGYQVGQFRALHSVVHCYLTSVTHL